MRWTKTNNPNRKGKRKPTGHSQKWLDEMREIRDAEIGKAIAAGADPNGPEVDAIIKAYNVTVNP